MVQGLGITGFRVSEAQRIKRDSSHNPKDRLKTQSPHTKHTKLFVLATIGPQRGPSDPTLGSIGPMP